MKHNKFLLYRYENDVCVVEYTNLRPTTVHSVGSLYPTVLHHVLVVWVVGTGYELQGVKGISVTKDELTALVVL